MMSNSDMKVIVEERYRGSRNSGKVDFFKTKKSRTMFSGNIVKLLGKTAEVSSGRPSEKGLPYSPRDFPVAPVGYNIVETDHVKAFDILIHEPFRSEEIAEVTRMSLFEDIGPLPQRTLEDVNNFLRDSDDLEFQPPKKRIVFRPCNEATNTYSKVFNQRSLGRRSLGERRRRKGIKVDESSWMKCPQHHCLNRALQNVIEFLYDPKNQNILACGADSRSGYAELLVTYDMNIGSATLLDGEHSTCVSDIKLSPDHERLVSCGHDGKIAVWEYEFSKKKANAYENDSREIGQFYRSIPRPKAFPSYECVLSKQIEDCQCFWIEFGRADGNVYVSDDRGSVHQVKYVGDHSSEQSCLWMKVWPASKKRPAKKIDEIILSPNIRHVMYCFSECNGDWRERLSGYRGDLTMFDMKHIRHYNNFNRVISRAKPRLILENFDVGSTGGSDIVGLGHHMNGQVSMIWSLDMSKKILGYSSTRKTAAHIKKSKVDVLVESQGCISRIKFDQRGFSKMIWFSKNSEVFGYDINNLDLGPTHVYSPCPRGGFITDFAVSGDLLCIATGKTLWIYNHRKNKFYRELNPEGTKDVTFNNCKFIDGPPKMLIACTDENQSIHMFKKSNCHKFDWKNGLVNY